METLHQFGIRFLIVDIQIHLAVDTPLGIGSPVFTGQELEMYTRIVLPDVIHDALHKGDDDHPVGQPLLGNQTHQGGNTIETVVSRILGIASDGRTLLDLDDRNLIQLFAEIQIVAQCHDLAHITHAITLLLQTGRQQTTGILLPDQLLGTAQTLQATVMVDDKQTILRVPDVTFQANSSCLGRIDKSCPCVLHTPDRSPVTDDLLCLCRP